MNTQIENTVSIESWFNEAIAGLKADELQLLCGVASNEKKATYDTLMRGNVDEMALLGKSHSDIHFYLSIMKKYVRTLMSKKGLGINKLAFSHTDSQVLVWAEVIEDKYDSTERALILSEAEANATFYPHGYAMSTTIVEDVDKLEVPSHYLLVNDEPINN